MTSTSVAVIASNAIFMVLACAAVLLRLYLRRMQKSPGSRAEDWLIVGALFFSAALAITDIVGVPVGGFGLPFVSLSEQKAETFLKVLFVLQFWYIIAIALVKLSMLCFYGRLFSAGRRYPIAVLVIFALTLGWLISFLFATFFQVWPIRCNWIACHPTTKYWVMYVCCSVTDILLDISILCLPISYIRKLRVRGGQKVGLVGIFGLGIFCVIASAARLTYAVKYVQVNIEGNYAVNFDTAVVNMIMWSGIEACASTICANLPCYAPLLKRAPTPTSIFTSFRSAFSGRRKEPSKKSFVEIGSVERVDRVGGKGTMNGKGSAGSSGGSEGDGGGGRGVYGGRAGTRTTVVGGKYRSRDERDLEMGRIRVETVVDANARNLTG